MLARTDNYFDFFRAGFYRFQNIWGKSDMFVGNKIVMISDISRT